MQVVLWKRLAVLLATVMMLGVMGVSPALAYYDVGHNFHSEAGNKSDDGADANKGGGQEHTRNGHPAHGGGEKHGGGDCSRGGDWCEF